MENDKTDNIRPTKTDSAETMQKKVDEAWKESVNRDKETPPDQAGREMPEASFGVFISSLMMEALVALGEIENPLSKKKDRNLAHAKFVIDTLAMLQEKTKNNLTSEESGALESILYDLRMRFVSKVGKK
ncbi:MAG: DUF1844 domain-containing protein [Candidatus Omnitrophica bacterium]|nr:DUF1844 domain-containing protein [Candidatus Omnitrophota bacterium]